MREGEITLREALLAWRSQVLEEGDIGEHIHYDKLHDLVLSPQKEEEALEHILKCPHCAGRLKMVVESMEEAEVYDYALPKIGAAELEGTVSIPSNGGKYTISLRRNLANRRAGLLTIEVHPKWKDKLEGKTVVVKDKKRNVLLEAQILSGKVAQRIEPIEDIDIAQLIVRMKR